MLDIIAGPDTRDRFSLPPPGVRYLDNIERSINGPKLAYTPNLGYAPVDVEIENLTRKAAFNFEMLECQVTEIKPDWLNMETDFMKLVPAEAVTANEKRLEEWKKLAYPYYSGYFELVKNLSAKDIIRVQFRREELWKKVRKIFEQYDFLLTPVTPVPAFEIQPNAASIPARISGRGVSPVGWMAFTFPFNLTGQPAASIPIAFTTRGLPVGLQIVGRRYDDDGVLRASRMYEKRFPWQQRKPPL
jgi:aspartyl-tRNA(Asn)/glutamyl-tRNA(Gln) amidotransferase subunit A